MVVNHHWVGRGNEHVNSEIELVVPVQQQGISDVSLSDERLLVLSAFVAIIVVFLQVDGFVGIEEEDTLGSMGTIPDFEDILHRFRLQLVLVGFRVDDIEELSAFSFFIHSIREGEEHLFVEADAVVLISLHILAGGLES